MEQQGKYRTPGGGRDDYETDPEFYNICDYEFRFELDAAASENNNKCKTYINAEQDALRQDLNWAHIKNSIWLNPPYGRGLVSKFLEKSWEASQEGATVVCLIHTCPDTKYWSEWIWNKAAEIRHVHGRLKFWLSEPDKKGNLGNTSDLPHSLVVYRPFYSGGTYISIWDWKLIYINKFKKLPIRSIKTREVVSYV